MADLAKTLRGVLPFVRRYLILDACFSAAALKYLQSAAPLEAAVRKTEAVLPPVQQDVPAGRSAAGTVLLAAASSQDFAYSDGGDYTRFSGALLEVLENGVGLPSSLLSMKQVGDTITALFREKYSGAKRPEVHSPDQRYGNLAEIALFPNPPLRTQTMLKRLELISARLDNVERSSHSPDVVGVAEVVRKSLDERLGAFEQRLAQLELLPVHESVASDTATESERRETRADRFGLTMNEWDSIPTCKREELFHWRSARRIGLISCVLAALLCGISGVSLLWNPRGAVSAVAFGTAVCGVVIFLTSLIRSSRFGYGGVAADEEPADWRGLIPILTLHSSGIRRLFGNLEVATPWFELATALFIVAALISSLSVFPFSFLHLIR